MEGISITTFTLFCSPLYAKSLHKSEIFTKPVVRPSLGFPEPPVFSSQHEVVATRSNFIICDVAQICVILRDMQELTT